MQQAVLRHFPDVEATYSFTHRDPDVYFTRECYNLFVESVKRTFPDTRLVNFSRSLYLMT